jgi:hypothetical protein
VVLLPPAPLAATVQRLTAITSSPPSVEATVKPDGLVAPEVLATFRSP